MTQANFTAAVGRAQVAAAGASARLRRRSLRIALARLLVFVVGIAAAAVAWSEGSPWPSAIATASLLAFVALVVLHARASLQERRAEAYRELFQAHARRSQPEKWVDTPEAEPVWAACHPYASDLDLFGAESLAARLDCSETQRGRRTLQRWLAAPAEASEVRGRQAAAQELSCDFAALIDVAAAGRVARAKGARLYEGPFVVFLRHRGLQPMRHAAGWLSLLPACTFALWLLHVFAHLPALWWIPFGLQVTVAHLLQGRTSRILDLVAARRGYVDAFASLWTKLLAARWQSATLQQLQARLQQGGMSTVTQLRQLDRYVGLAELRHHFPVNLLANWFLLWDLQLVQALLRWRRRAGTGLRQAFTVLGDFEALAAFACFHLSDSGTSWPDVQTDVGGLQAEALAHPLLCRTVRVANDVQLSGPGQLLLITGSNMAGKSTLLRAVGLNVALALAGGPVVARQLRLAPVRLRASMRIHDSLQRGSSYFHAELARVKQVVQDAEAVPPVLFLLDEVLRGTHAEARHRGARALLLHLLRRGALGILATHDKALTALAQELPKQVHNAHFTDIMQDGEMIFDYRLRPGVVQSSNALRLLAQAGIDIDAS